MDKVTKIKDLIAALQDCDPDGTVTVSLDAALLYDDEEPGDVEYGFTPSVDFLFSRSDADRSDRVHIRIPEDETKDIVETRRRQLSANMAALANATPANPAVVVGAPVAIALGLSEDTYANLLAVVDHCNQADDRNKGATTHGKLDVSGLLAMLADDAAMTNSRPGSWEGANLQQVLDSHGYA